MCGTAPFVQKKYKTLLVSYTIFFSFMYILNLCRDRDVKLDKHTNNGVTK